MCIWNVSSSLKRKSYYLINQKATFIEKQWKGKGIMYILINALIPTTNTHPTSTSIQSYFFLGFFKLCTLVDLRYFYSSSLVKSPKFST